MVLLRHWRAAAPLIGFLLVIFIFWLFRLFYFVSSVTWHSLSDYISRFPPDGSWYGLKWLPTTWRSTVGVFLVERWKVTFRRFCRTTWLGVHIHSSCHSGKKAAENFSEGKAAGFRMTSSSSQLLAIFLHLSVSLPQPSWSWPPRCGWRWDSLTAI